MKIGQPKLSEGKSQRSGLFVTPAYLHFKIILIDEDYGLKDLQKENNQLDPTLLSIINSNFRF
jgi:hypothetical protein